MPSSYMLSVHFHDVLLQPPPDRQRKSHHPYPAVAQSKGKSDRRQSDDLYWRWSTLSAVKGSFSDEESLGGHPVTIVRNAMWALVDHMETTASKISPSRLHDCHQEKFMSSQASSSYSRSAYSSSASMSDTDFEDE